MANGEWEPTPQEKEDAEAKRGEGRCYWWGCNGPGWKENPAMVNWPRLRDDPMYRLCAKHHAESLERTQAAIAALEAPHPVKGKWEAPRGSQPALAAVMREKKIEEARSLRERDGHRQDLVQEWNNHKS